MSEPAISASSSCASSSPRRRWLKTSAIFAAGMATAVLINHFMAPAPRVHMPEIGGTMDISFRALEVIQPESGIPDGEGRQTTGYTMEWEFQNRSDRPIQLGVPSQEFHIVFGVRDSDFLEMPAFLRSGSPLIPTRQFEELPASLILDPPQTLAPGEKRTFRAGGKGWLHDAGKPIPPTGVEIVASIDGKPHILVSAVTVRE